MTVTIKLFGMLKTLTGNQGELQVDLGDKGTVYELAHNIQAKFPEIGDLLLKKKVLVSVNHDIAHWDTELTSSDEIALLPPFAGGTSRLLKKPASFLLASLRGSTYQKEYASPLRSLRPRWTAFLNSLQLLWTYHGKVKFSVQEIEQGFSRPRY